MATANLDSAATASGDFFDNAGHRPLLALEEAAVALDLEPWIVDRLRHPVEESTSYIQLVPDSGDAVCVPLLQVQHTATYPSTIGSFAMQPDLDLQSCEALAMERTWQAALLELPLGGAAYGLVVDPDRLNERELTKLLAICARRLNNASAAESWLFSGRDCGPEIMAQLFAGLRSDHRWNITGKPACLGGQNLDLFAAEGIAAAASLALRQSGHATAIAKVAVQGFRSLGQAVCHRLTKHGFRIVGVSDSSAGIYRSDGLILDDVERHYDREHVLFGYAEAEAISRAELLRTDADVLVLTSGTNEVHQRNCGQITAGVIAEADWNGVSTSAKTILSAGQVTVVPWMLATAGALIGSYLEGRGSHVLMSGEELLSGARHSIEDVIDHVIKYAGSEYTWEQSARLIAVERVAKQMRICRDAS